MKLLVGFLVGLVICPVILIFVIVTGAVSVSATNKLQWLEGVFGYASARSVARRAPPQSNPYRGDPKALAVGFEHYRDTCLLCHGGPTVQPREFGKGLNPTAPELSSTETQELSDGELYWIIANGIMMTGMPAFRPTHDEETLWKIVAFVRHLPNLSREEKERLAEGVRSHRSRDAE